MSALRAFVAASLVIVSAGALQGCREIVGVPSGSSLSDIERIPPLCECGPLEQQPGGDVVVACEKAYESLPDFGEGDAAAPFGSKEELLASDCAVCRQDDPARLRDCFGQLLDSAEPGASPRVGSEGSACETAGDCGSWACCSDGAAGSCCGSCVGCAPHVASNGADVLCLEDAAVFALLGKCLCEALIERDPPVGCIQECGRLTEPNCRPDSAECVNCLSALAAIAPQVCDPELLACQSSVVRRPAGGGG